MKKSIDEILENIEKVKKAVYENFIADEFKKGNISIRQVVIMLGLTYKNFMVDFLRKRKIFFLNACNFVFEIQCH